MVEYISEYGHPFADDTREKVGVIVYDKVGKVLMVEGISGKISFPKGGRLRGETEYEGAIREAWEETGIDLELMKYKRKIKLIWGTYFIYHLNILGNTLLLKPQPGEIVKILWKKPNSYWSRKIGNMNCDLGYFIQKYAI